MRLRSQVDGMGGAVAGLRRWAPLAAIVTLLGAALLAAVYANPVVATVPPAERASSPTADPSESTATATDQALPTSSGTPQPASQIPTVVVYTVSIACLAAVLVIVVSLAWFAIRSRVGRRGRKTAQRGAAPTLAETRNSVAALLEASLAELDDADNDPRRVVIACWVRLEQAATAAGAQRTVADTSTDLVDRLLRAHLVVRGQVLADLAELYRQARYAPHVVDVTMREQARAALRELRQELRSVRPVVGSEV
jgi:hypothetical protein